MTGHEVIEAAIVFINYGPYHLARARALLEIPDLRPSFIQLASSIDSHPWQVEEAASRLKLRTLSQLSYEQCSYTQLSRSLRIALNEINPRVVVTASYRPFIMLTAARWARSHGRRAVLFFETTRSDRYRRPLAEMLKRWTIAAYYDAAFAGGKAHCDYLMQLGMPGCRIWQPYDVVDNHYFAAMAADVRSDHEHWRNRLELPQRYFLYVGRYSPEKNLLRLLRAYRIYRTRFPAAWPLVLVGHGTQRAELENYVSDAELRGVILRPFEQLQTLPAYYALAGCFVLPSTVDPWGLVVNEAMACGLPVIVSRLCGCGFDLVREGSNGFLFDPYDIDALADLLGRMSSLDETTRQSMSAQSRRIISTFTPNIWADRLAQCIRMVVREAGGRIDIGTELIDCSQYSAGHDRA
jgi:1,2-diacylglycerol 3-alpha-glucosyltransferase